MNAENRLQLNAPAGNLPSLMTAVDAGADSVYLGFRSPTNLRNLPGLNFSVEEASEGVAYAHKRDVSVYVAVNTHPLDGQLEECFRAVDDAANIGADAVIAVDLAVLEHARTRHPHLDIHLSCMAGAADAEAIRFYRQEFDIRCVVLPRVLSLRQIASLRRQTDAMLEVMVFGVLCANYEGRCFLSSFLTGISANSMGACAPAEHVVLEETEDGGCKVKLNGVEIYTFADSQRSTYPTPCKGTYRNSIAGCRSHVFQEPCCLDAMALLGDLSEAGVNILKIEGRQRSLAYVRQVTAAWREAIDNLEHADASGRRTDENTELQSVMEGQAGSLGALAGGMSH